MKKQLRDLLNFISINEMTGKRSKRYITEVSRMSIRAASAQKLMCLRGIRNSIRRTFKYGMVRYGLVFIDSTM